MRSFFQAGRRLKRYTVVAAFPAMLLAFLFMAQSASAQTLDEGQIMSGPMLESDENEAIDGDTLKIGKHVVHLYGIDAPELGQACLTRLSQQWHCGQQIRDALNKKVADTKVKCDIMGLTTGDDFVGRCRFAEEKMDIGLWMIRNGLAFSAQERGYEYQADEKTARLSKLGVWNGTCMFPWDFRELRRQSRENEEANKLNKKRALQKERELEEQRKAARRHVREQKKKLNP